MEEMASLSVDDEENEEVPEIKIKMNDQEMEDDTDLNLLPKNVLDII